MKPRSEKKNAQRAFAVSVPRTFLYFLSCHCGQVSFGHADFSSVVQRGRPLATLLRTKKHASSLPWEPGIKPRSKKKNAQRVFR